MDAKKAHLNGVVDDDVFVYIELPTEAGAKEKCGRLRRWLYRMRGAGHAWEKDYSRRFVEVGFKKGRVAPTVFYHQEKQLRCVVHGVDFTFLGFDRDLGWVSDLMSKWYETKVRGRVGGGDSDDREITILNRVGRRRGDTMEMEADP